MDKTKWIIFGTVCFSILALMVVFNKKDETTFNGDAGAVINEGPIADRTKGSKDNKVVLIEYADYQCPACSTMSPKIKELTDKYSQQLTFVFRNLPLSNIHPNALAASAAAEAAGQQGKFFEMHDALYKNQSSWSSADPNDRTALFEMYAQSLGLDIDKFKQDLNSTEVNQKIDRDRATARSFKLNATPSFILNGQKVPESTGLNVEELEKAVRGELEKAGYKLDQ